MAGTGSAGGDVSAWAPLRRRAFRWLWLGVLISLTGTWMQTVGAQWLLVDQPNAAALVALVPVANTLPVMLLALPGGVLADSFDRRWLLFTVQVYFFVVGMLLVGLTVAGQMPPGLLLTFTFALGVGTAVQLPAWQAVIPDLVPRNEIGAATRWEMVGVNVARSVGPALAGLVIAAFGVSTVFAINAVSVVFLAAALLMWRRPQVDSELGRERFVPALRAGGRYIRHEPLVRRILLRAVLFITPAMALWALLPLVARQELGLGAGGYGALFGALGVGAIVGALALGRVRNRLSTNAMLTAAGVLYVAALVGIVEAPDFAVALLILVFAGLAWVAVVSTLNAELAIFLPVWVRARGLAVYMVAFTGSQAVGAVIWGLVAQGTDLTTAFLLAALAAAAGVVAGLFWRVPETGHLDRTPALYWSDVRLAIDPEPDSGPVLVTVEYTVSPERQEGFLATTGPLRQSRLRTGATRWELYQDGERPDRFIEIFSIPSWEEHQRQHSGRLTAADQDSERAAQAFSDPPAHADHLLPPARQPGKPHQPPTH